ncbi:type I secretion system permease/ATPase [Bradyrhizobium sp. ISRA443]|uniref:type I secretion system permease/ATPase n=1 Tax=unclassified Bradyrhizobium TaxID=2631580 RepID=UPI00247979A2|nr:MULTISPECIES: type I secretion system permease/ATPase [unclassified Bradyrhizobium]WGR96195.1 type I secretion system permease/ATPase [Bradyrhizobium sp. ISRA435]WGS02753.1 type I secretion system permease/ATPase [Bradyrhizobium sp. ISRA436]WGS09638.1 type I secretion system permease/ATPase [Bradyrhizobium sp. ISRA437]WGS16523.1 type I secretion system permease/ATPase [Bradyrhizobium sp. ISRA443]
MDNPNSKPATQSRPRALGDDPLTASLTYLAAHHGRAVSREALLGGLPITDGRLTVSLYDRAARRAGLETEAVKRDISDIPALVLPAVLVMKNGTALILLGMDPAKKTINVVDPTTPGASRIAEIKAIAADYTGYAFLVRVAPQADARAVAAGDLPSSHWFWSVVKTHWRSYGHIALAAFLTNILALATPLFTMSVYDRVIPNGAIPSLIALSIGMGLAIVFDFVFRMVRSRMIDVTGKTVDVVLAANIFEHVMAVRMAQRPTSVGIIANQLRDFDSVREFFTSGSVVSATDLLFAILFVAVLYIIAGPLAWIPLVMLPLVMLVGFLLQRPLHRAMKRLQAESAARHGVLVESLSGLETVRATGAEARMQTLWERSVAATARSGEDVHFWSSLSLTSASTAQQITSLLLVIVGIFLILDGKLTVGALVAANMLAGRVLAPIAGIANVITKGTQTIASLKAIDRIMSLDRERSPHRSYVSRRIEEGRIAFENVSFAYPNAPGNALDKVSFKIEGGEKVGIIGRVGSGKTTVGRLLLGFYEAKEGRILVDGVDSRQYDPSDLRTGIGFAMQDTDLFFGKLRDNIALGKPEATDEEILLAARLSGVENFIAGHPMGYDMPISEGGRSLSGGQKQAIGLARVLIRKPRVLFLDEPTAHFDIRSEQEFLERLKGLRDERMTIIISTHRLSLLNMVDRLLLFDNGRLVADGPRDKVLALLQGRPAAAPPSPENTIQPKSA